MTHAVFMKKQKKLKNLVVKYQKKLNLMNWNITTTLCDKNNDDDPVASMTVQVPYLRAALKVYPCAFDKDEDLDHIVKHELCHIITAHSKLMAYDLLNGKLRTHQEIDDNNEWMTETIARLV